MDIGTAVKISVLWAQCISGARLDALEIKSDMPFDSFDPFELNEHQSPECSAQRFTVMDLAKSKCECFFLWLSTFIKSASENFNNYGYAPFWWSPETAKHKTINFHFSPRVTVLRLDVVVSAFRFAVAAVSFWAAFELGFLLAETNHDFERVSLIITFIWHNTEYRIKY